MSSERGTSYYKERLATHDMLFSPLMRRLYLRSKLGYEKTCPSRERLALSLFPLRGQRGNGHPRQSTCAAA